MKIINKENYITNNQIKEILKLLGKEHIPRRIIVYENKFDIVLYKIKNLYNYKELLSKGDTYTILNDTIYLLVNKYEDNEKLEFEDIQFNLIRDLVYLIKQRHYYKDYLKEKDFSIKEAFKNLDIFSVGDLNYGLEILNDGKYDDLIDRFVVKFMNDNKHLIKDIMGWKEECELED